MRRGGVPARAGFRRAGTWPRRRRRRGALWRVGREPGHPDPPCRALLVADGRHQCLAGGHGCELGRQRRVARELDDRFAGGCGKGSRRVPWARGRSRPGTRTHGQQRSSPMGSPLRGGAPEPDRRVRRDAPWLPAGAESLRLHVAVPACRRAAGPARPRDFQQRRLAPSLGAERDGPARAHGLPEAHRALLRAGSPTASATAPRPSAGQWR